MHTGVAAIKNIDVTITGHSSTSLIIRQDWCKRHLSCSTADLLEELSSKLPCKRTITVESNVITGYKKLTISVYNLDPADLKFLCEVFFSSCQKLFTKKQ